MKIQKNRRNYHVLLILILLSIAVLLEVIIYFHFDELRRQPIVINQFLEIYPIYNRNGTWLHGEIGIGYIAWLLYLEAILSLIILVVMARYMDVLICFFRLSPRWLYLVDVGAVPGIYRILTRIRGAYTLDYLQINQIVYDFPDFCIGIFIVGICIWAIRVSFLFCQYMREKRRGMSFTERIVWGVRFRRMIFRMIFLPKVQWQGKFEQWEGNQI